MAASTTAATSNINQEFLIPGDKDLVVHLVGGRDLAKKDPMGKSDPYASMKLFPTGEVHTSRVVKQSLSPDWGQSFRFRLPPNADLNQLSLQITLWDKDTWTADDYMGTVWLNELDKASDAKWLKVECAPGRKNHVSGE